MDGGDLIGGGGWRTGADASARFTSASLALYHVHQDAKPFSSPRQVWSQPCSTHLVSRDDNTWKAKHHKETSIRVEDYQWMCVVNPIGDTFLLTSWSRITFSA